MNKKEIKEIRQMALRTLNGALGLKGFINNKGEAIFIQN